MSWKKSNSSRNVHYFSETLASQKESAGNSLSDIKVNLDIISE